MTAIRLTVRWVAEATAGTVHGEATDREVGDVVTDSRVVTEGDLFVALQGPRFDAHDFVGDVLARGAAAAVVRRGFTKGSGSAATGGGAFIEVDDTLVALQRLAHAVRVEAGTRVVAITGSAGKTTTKETIAEFLSARFTVVKNKGNLNNHIGLPLSLMQLRGRPDVAVMELGMNHAGEISALVAIAEPEVRVWTNVGDAHLGFFDSPDAIADAKAEILDRATPASLLVCNADDPRVMSRAAGFAGRTLTFGTAEGADVRAVDVEERGINGMRARVITPSGEASIETPLLGHGNLSNVLAATAVAIDAGIPLETIAATAARLRPADRRGAVHRLRDGISLVDDTYNSSPAALRRALDAIAASPARRKVAALGEMLELGAHASRLHAESGRAAAAAGIDVLVAIGGAPARELAAAAVAAGMPAEAVRHVDTSEEAASALVEIVAPGDLVLVKGSRGIRTDVVADRLRAEFA